MKSLNNTSELWISNTYDIDHIENVCCYDQCCVVSSW